MTAVTLDHVTLCVGERTILHDVNFDIGDSEFVGLLGANGAGKTTLLRALLGVLPPVAGEITVFGQAAARGNAGIGYMPHMRSQGENSRLSGWDFVAGVVNGHRLGLPILSRADRAEVSWALDLVAGRELSHWPLANMSGGERQRILLAQALVGHPRMLLLDEPLISLDPAQQVLVVNLVKRVQLELHIPVLFSSHELNPLLGVLDRVLYLGNQHAAIGSVDDVVTTPF